MLVKATGKIIFDLPLETNKHKEQSLWKSTAMILTKCDLDLYYGWFLRKRFDLELVRPLRGAHVTIINEQVPKDKFLLGKELFNKKKIEFFIDPEPRSDGKYWWLRVYCSQAEEIREAIGLRRIPFFAFHLTIGYANEKTMAQSMYILEKCKEFNLISSEPKAPFESHEIKIYEK